MRVGYARISSPDQNLDRQLHELDRRCDRVVTEVISGPLPDKTELDRLVSGLSAGDVLVLHELDRCSRSTLEFLRLVSRVDERGAHVEVLSPAINLGGEFGRIIATILMAFAEYELKLQKKRQREGIERARARGTHLGRPRKLTRFQREKAIQLYKEGTPQKEIAAIMGVSAPTIWRVINDGS